MEPVIDVVALGELLIDFTMNGESCQGNPLFEANPGGAPCNVLAMLKKPWAAPAPLWARWGTTCLAASCGRWPKKQASAWMD